ncbi:hypothetical protein TNCV_2813541 [Trichonephila clavipes]|nr:hypothetical protein TNCV_2813541 [Trichonephila clavipes]
MCGMWSGIILLKKKVMLPQKERQQNSSQNVVDLPLRCKCSSNDDQRGPAIKRNGTPDRNSCLRACVECNRDRQGALGISRHIFDDRQDIVGSGIRR